VSSRHPSARQQLPDRSSVASRRAASGKRTQGLQALAGRVDRPLQFGPPETPPGGADPAIAGLLSFRLFGEAAPHRQRQCGPVADDVGDREPGQVHEAHGPARPESDPQVHLPEPGVRHRSEP
jgi:hypothetical protein